MFLAKAYFIREYIKILCLTFILSIFFIFVLDFAEVIRSTTDSIDISLLEKLIITLSKSSKNFIQLIPLIIFIGTTVTFVTLNRRNELVVFTTLGIPQSFFIISILLVSIVIFFLTIFVFMPINGGLSIKSDNISGQVKLDSSGIFFKTAGNIFIKAERTNNNLTKLYNLIIWDLNDKFIIEEVITAAYSDISDKKLILNDVIITSKLSENHVKRYVIELDISLLNIVNKILKPEQINILEIPSFSAILSKFGFSTEYYKRYFWDKMTMWINFLTMALIGFNSSFSMIRRFFNKGKIYFGGIIGLLVFFTSDFLITLGLNNNFTVPVAVIGSKLFVSALLLLTNMKSFYRRHKFI